MRIFWIILGTVCFVLGTVGIVLPILPTVPFYLVTVYSYARGSKRLHDWFVGTDLYKNHLDEFVQKKGMTLSAKIKMFTVITLLMGFGFFMMSEVPVGRIVLVIVWLAHIYMVFFYMKTIVDPEKRRQGEIKILEEMIALYCKKNHKPHGEKYCKECQELVEYGTSRVKLCPFMETKTFCSNCEVHCYRPQMREEIKKVMRFSGPRMLFSHPILTIWHLLSSKL